MSFSSLTVSLKTSIQAEVGEKIAHQMFRPLSPHFSV